MTRGREVAPVEYGAALAAVRAYLTVQESNPPVLERANLLEDVVRAFYDHAKFRAPGGEGLDGRDGPECRAIGHVVDAARDWVDEARTLQ